MDENKKFLEQGMDTETPFGKMQRLITAELEKPENDIESLAKKFGFEGALVYQGTGKKRIISTVRWEKIPVFEVLQQLEHGHFKKLTPEGGPVKESAREMLKRVTAAHKEWKSTAKKGEEFSREWMKKNGYRDVLEDGYRSESGLTVENVVDLSGNPELQRDFKFYNKMEIKDEADATQALKDLFKTWQDDTDPQKGGFNIAYFRKQKNQLLYEWSSKEGNKNLHQLAEQTNDPALIAEVKKINLAKK